MAEQRAGLMESVKRLAVTLSAIVSTRLELLSNELQEERLYLARVFFLSVSAAFCFGLAVLLLTVFIVVLFWDDHRLAALGSLSVFFLCLGASVLVLLRGQKRAKSKLFSTSLAELAKDREQLGGSNE
ncbi:MAG: phage holin family protein [Gallionella sp.]|jgi:uncharacterized membrane protein YqjE|nr:phage holin family protein [Gallionella sp.]